MNNGTGRATPTPTAPRLHKSTLQKGWRVESLAGHSCHPFLLKSGGVSEACQCAVNAALIRSRELSYRGGGLAQGRGGFVWRQCRRGNFREGEISTHLQFWCGAIRHATLAGPNLERYQLIGDEHKRARPRLARRTEGGTSSTEDAHGAGSAPNGAQKVRGEDLHTKLKTEIFPTKLSPRNCPLTNTPPPLCTMTHCKHKEVSN